MFNCVRHVLPVLPVPLEMFSSLLHGQPSCLTTTCHRPGTLDHDVDLNLDHDVEVDVCLQVLLADKLAATSDCSCLRLWVLSKGDLFATLDMEVSVLRIVMIRAKTNI